MSHQTLSTFKQPPLVKEYTMAAAASNTAGEIDPIADFCSICNVQPDVAERYLHATRGSLTIALEFYYQNQLRREHENRWLDRENENDSAIDEFMPSGEFSPRPASKRAIADLIKFEVKESQLEAVKNEMEENTNEDKSIQPPAGAEIAATHATNQTETILIKSKETSPGNIQNSKDKSLEGGSKIESEETNMCSKNIPDKVDSCTICLCSFEVGDMASKLPCGHVFHCKCINQWLQKGRNTCPLCRHELGCDPADDENSSPPFGAETPNFPSYHPQVLLVPASLFSHGPSSYESPGEVCQPPHRRSGDVSAGGMTSPRGSLMHRAPGAERSQSRKHHNHSRTRLRSRPADAETDHARTNRRQRAPRAVHPCHAGSWGYRPLPPNPCDEYPQPYQPYRHRRVRTARAQYPPHHSPHQYCPYYPRQPTPDHARDPRLLPQYHAHPSAQFAMYPQNSPDSMVAGGLPMGFPYPPSAQFAMYPQNSPDSMVMGGLPMGFPYPPAQFLMLN